MLIRRLVEDIKVFSYFYDIIIITDARLVNEIEIPKATFENVTTIRVMRNKDNELTVEQKQHLTEIDLDNYMMFDYVLDNNDNNYDLLRQKVYQILDEVNYE